MTSTPNLPRVRVESTAQIADYPAGATFGPRRVADYELIWLLRGSARWTRRDLDPTGVLGDEVAVTLRPGQLALARRGTRDLFVWDTERPSRHGYLHLTLDDPGSLGPEQAWPAVVATSAFSVLEGLCRYLLELSASAAQPAWDRSDQVVGLMLDIMVNGPAPAASEAWPESLLALVEHVRRDWTRHGMRMIEIGELAEAAHLSTGHLHRLFRECCDCGPAHALELIRLARAAISLQRSNAPLAAIARATGFANAYHFSRRFSAAYGCPPGAFRRLTGPPGEPSGEHGQPTDPLGPVRRARLSVIAQRLL